jgi:hypothetical protein
VERLVKRVADELGHRWMEATTASDAHEAQSMISRMEIASCWDVVSEPEFR